MGVCIFLCEKAQGFSKKMRRSSMKSDEMKRRSLESFLQGDIPCEKVRFDGDIMPSLHLNHSLGSSNNSTTSPLTFSNVLRIAQDVSIYQTYTPKSAEDDPTHAGEIPQRYPDPAIWPPLELQSHASQDKWAE
jgi:hypothetical protein